MPVKKNRTGAQLKEAITELERASAMLDSDPERIMALSPQELREEMEEAGLDLSKPAPRELTAASK